MPYDTPLASQNTPGTIRSGAQIVRYPKSRTARASANEVAPNLRPIEAMLLVHQEQVETFRLIFAALRRGLKALARSYAA